VRFLLLVGALVVALFLFNRCADASASSGRVPPHFREWLCIHRYERGAAGWRTNTGNGYYGGLQMDISFQRAYGYGIYRFKGTADNWSRLEQMWVAERAWRSRGFHPWPHTARLCGLI